MCANYHNYYFLLLYIIHVVDPCANDPCQNEETCVAIYALTAAGYYCQCKSGYSGVLCEHQPTSIAVQTEPGEN